MARSGLKAGLVGAAVAVLLSLLGAVPMLYCIAGALGLLWYVGVGALAAHWLEPPATAEAGAGAGAIAGAITGVASGIASMVTGPFRLYGGIRPSFRVLRLTPGDLRQMQGGGFADLILGNLGGVVSLSAFCFAVGLVLAAVLGAAGGAMGAAARGDREVGSL